MSYCRFRNTLTDLEDCWEAINSTDEMEDLSREEIYALTGLVTMSKIIAERFEGLDEHELIIKLTRKELI